MSEHDDRYASTDLPRTTGEFRATPDASASTAEFKAFVANQDQQDSERGGQRGSWPAQPWAGDAQGTGSRRTLGLIVGAVVVVAIVVILIVALG
jgi:hypothetical protein